MAEKVLPAFRALTDACTGAPSQPPASQARRLRAWKRGKKWSDAMTRAVEDADALVDAFEAEHYSCVPTTHLTSHGIHVAPEADLEDAAGGTSVLADVSLGREIGSGGFGRVYEGRWQGVRVAVKKVHNDSGAALEQRRQALLSEAQVLEKISHFHIVTFYGVAQAYDGAWLLVTEFVPGGDLRRALYPKEGTCILTTSKKEEIAIGIAAGLWHLQSKGIVHQDLKPGNVLLTSERVAKLCDFGLASLGNRLRGGTHAYMAPEQWMKQATISSKVDTFAYGILLNEVITVSPPWPSLSGKERLREAVLNGQRPQLAGVQQLDELKTEYRKIIVMCWQAEEAKRPTMAAVCKELTRLKDGGENPAPSEGSASCESPYANYVGPNDVSSCSTSDMTSISVALRDAEGLRGARALPPSTSSRSEAQSVSFAWLNKLEECEGDEDTDVEPVVGSGAGLGAGPSGGTPVPVSTHPFTGVPPSQGPTLPAPSYHEVAHTTSHNVERSGSLECVRAMRV